MAPLPMDEKRPFAETEVHNSRAPAARRRRSSCLALFVAAVLMMSGLFLVLPSGRRPWKTEAGAGGASVAVSWAETTETPVDASARLVPLEAHIMSKCPDALDCLRKLVLPAMQVVHEKTNFTLSYIGQVTRDGGVACKHGPEECLGNILELCAAELYPDPKTYLGFTMCLTRDFPSIPARSLVEDCALEHAVDFEQLNACATRDDGEYGMHLLRRSVQHSADVGVTRSCTVRLDDQVYCIRDDGEWKDCPGGPSVNDLIVAVEKLSRE